MKLNKLAMILLCSMFPVQLSYAVVGQTCVTTLPEVTPTSRFTLDDTNGTALDNQTQLVWKRCLEGQTWDVATTSCTGSATTYNWKDALGAAVTANSSNFLGNSDWRVPNTKELFSIVETRCYVRALNETVFKGFNISAWTSSPYLTNNLDTGQKALRVNFYDGSMSKELKSNTFSVRLVRSN